MDNNEQKNDEINNQIRKVEIILEEKQEEKKKSLTKEHEIGKIIEKLEIQKNMIDKRKKSKLKPIMFYAVYSLIICLIDMLFISSFIDKFTLTASPIALYVVEIYIGVTSISLLGAYTMAKTGDLIRNKRNKKLSKLSVQLEEKQIELKREKEKQEMLDKEIAIILNNQEKGKNIKNQEIENQSNKIISSVTNDSVYTEEYKPFMKTKTKFY